jgi:MFS family permease
MWAAMLGMFCANYPYFLVLSWLPLFLVKEHGFSMAAMAWIGAAVYVIAGLVNVIAGRMADRAIARGADITRTRKAALVAGGAIAVGCMALCALGGPQLAVAGLLLFSLSPGLMVFSTMSAGQTLAGPRAAGKWVGLQNGVGGISGVVGPLLTGVLLDATGDYRVAFLFAAAIAACGMVFWGVMIRWIEPLSWRAAPAP